MLFRNRVECLLDYVASEWIHTQRKNVTMDGICDRNDLFGSTMLEATLYQEIAKAIDHEWICLVDDGLDDFELLFGCADFQLLL